MSLAGYRMNPPTIKIGGLDTVIYHGACVDCSSQWTEGLDHCKGCYFCPFQNYGTAKNLQKPTRDGTLRYSDPLEIIDKLPAWEWIVKDPNILDVPDRRHLWELIHKMRETLRLHGYKSK